MFVDTLQVEVDTITTALTWAVFAGNVLAGLLFLWDSLRSAPRHWPSVAGSGGMLLVALLSIIAYALALLPTRAHAPLFLLLLPLAVSAFLTALYALTASQRVPNRLQRGLLVTLLVAAGLDLLGLFLTDLWGP